MTIPKQKKETLYVVRKMLNRKAMKEIGGDENEDCKVRRTNFPILTPSIGTDAALAGRAYATSIDGGGEE